ncbi:uncharacterized protein LOC122252035 [Penaeus japonicus]|uniref:uncharacterized protein LOC122252035 n=1 Tax=Penaeus japonicus TaxID=27405 RepID=UPI001C712EB3|nr:uncharacterized protein LOC122252035 [Penaeus japonicus]
MHPYKNATMFLFVLCVSAAIGVAEATLDLTQESNDCEVLQLPHGYPIKVFEETLQVAVFHLDGPLVSAEAAISDAAGHKCLVHIRTDADNASLADVDVKCSNNFTASSRIANAFRPDKWTQLFISVEAIADDDDDEDDDQDDSSSSDDDLHDILVMVRREKERDFFLKIFPSDLQPPLRMRWYTDHNMSIVFNCGKGEGCQLHNDALHHGRGRDSFFFFQPALTPAAMDITVALYPGKVLTIPLRQEIPSTKGWKAVRLTRDRNAINVWIDDQKVKRVDTRVTFPDNDILDVKLVGSGQMMTWCDPRPTLEDTKVLSSTLKPHVLFDFLPWILAAVFLLVSVVVTVFLVRSRRSLSRTKRALRDQDSPSTTPLDNSVIQMPHDLQLLPSAQSSLRSFGAPSRVRNSDRHSQLSYDNPMPHVM